MKEWFEIGLMVPAACGEAISNFLAEQGTTGIEEVDDEGPEWKRLKAYFPTNRSKKRLLQDLNRYVDSLREIYPDLVRSRIEIRSIPEQDWSESWKAFFKPLRVTPNFLVKAPWSSVRRKKGQIQIIITPGMAFGIGSHETTRLCIRAVGKRLSKRMASVLDVGTGSGILAIIAAKKGAREVWGIDIDPVAVEAAVDNVIRNGVSDRVRIREGSISRIRKRFDLVAANIDFKSLKKMRAPLIRRVKPGGVLILSGILTRDEEAIRERFEEHSLLKRVETDREGEWSCLTFRKQRD